MLASRFKNYISVLHEMWLGRALNMPLNSIGGIDLLDSKKGVEVKSCLVLPDCKDSRRKYVKWTAFDGQWDYDRESSVPIYLGLGFYHLDIPVKKLRTIDSEILEDHVTYREFSVISWEWCKQFPVHKGKYHDYIYLRPNPQKQTNLLPFPEVVKTIRAEKGLVHFTAGVNVELFGL
jgi:hypothetical protein